MSSVERRAAGNPAYGVITMRLVGFAADGMPMVAEGDAQPVVARSVVPITPEMLGAEAVIALDRGNPLAPVILGVIQPVRPLPQTLRLGAEDSVEITCGKSAVILRADGKIVVQGEYLLSRARRTNRIEGGAISFN